MPRKKHGKLHDKPIALKLVAALYDIHGNLPALEAVLTDVRRAKVDAVVVGGDVVPGPMASECLALLGQLEVPTHFLRGNGEVAVRDILRGKTPAHLPEPVLKTLRWSADSLPAVQREFIATWPQIVKLSIIGLGDVLFCHGSPRSVHENITEQTPEKALEPTFQGIDASCVVGGHTHMQFDRRLDALRLVNAGSIGMPFGAPGAYWALLGPGVALQRTVYDLDAAAKRIRSTAYPGAADFAASYVLHPPSAKEMMARFEARPFEVIHTAWASEAPPHGAFDDFVVLDAVAQRSRFFMRTEEFEFLAGQMFDNWQAGKSGYVQVLREWNECVGFNGLEEAPSMLEDVAETVGAVALVEGAAEHAFGKMGVEDVGRLQAFLARHQLVEVWVYRL